MRDGALPFRDIFSPQGPLHLVLIRLFDLIGGYTLNGPRLLTVAAGLAITATVASAVKLSGTTASAWFIAALATTSGSLLWVTAPITGDGPAIVWVSGAVLAAYAWSKHPTPIRAALVGLLAGCALATKLIVAPAGILIAGILLIGRRPRHTIIATVTATVVIVGSALTFGIDRVYEQSIAYHNNSDRLESISSQATKLLTTLLSRDLLLIVVSIGPFAWFMIRRIRRLEPLDWLLVLWLVAQIVVLIFEKTMFRNHLATVVVPLALIAARFPINRRAAIVLVAVLAPWWHTNNFEILHPSPAPKAEHDLVAALRNLPSGAQVISDEPGLAWRAERRLPPWLVDASVKRIDSGQLNTATMTRFAADQKVCAFVQWSYRYGQRLVGIDEALRKLGYSATSTYGRWHGADGTAGDRVLWLRECVR